MDLRRSLLTVSLGLVLFLIWQSWVSYKAALDESQITTQLQQESEVPLSPTQTNVQESDVPTAVSVDEPGVATEVAPARSLLESGERVVVKTDLLEVELDTYGGELREARLLKYPVEVEMPDVPFRMLKSSSPAMLIAQSGLVGANNTVHLDQKTLFEAESDSYILSESDNSIRVPLHWTSPEGVRYTKTYVFYRDSYLVDVEFDVYNSSAQPWQGYQYGLFLSTPPASDSGGFFLMRALPSYQGAAVYTPENKYEKVDYDEILDERPTFEAESGWVAMLQHYFVTAWLPEENSPYRFFTKALRGKEQTGSTLYQAGYIALTPTEVSPGGTGTLYSRIYLGPKEQNRIRDPAEGLILTVDYGWLTPVSSPLFWVLQKINDYVNNWGWSIILLTFLVKLAFYPLSATAYKSMGKMKKLGPRMKTLKERYGDDKQKFQQEMMQIYKQEKINPLGGCLPILIQIPVFIALYWVLLESVELRQAPFIFWLTDLSRADPFYVLPILMGASMFGQHFLNPTPLEPLQRNIMMSLPIVFTFFFLWFPAGLVLYWLVNNILSIAQQWYITRKLLKT